MAVESFLLRCRSSRQENHANLSTKRTSSTRASRHDFSGNFFKYLEVIYKIATSLLMGIQKRLSIRDNISGRDDDLIT